MPARESPAAFWLAVNAADKQHFCAICLLHNLSGRQDGQVPILIPASPCVDLTSMNLLLRRFHLLYHADGTHPSFQRSFRLNLQHVSCLPTWCIAGPQTLPSAELR